MAWTVYQIVLAVVMVVTGSINTLSTKWADNSEAKNLDGQTVKFDHPFLQATGMFIGEFSCLVVFGLLRAFGRAQQQVDAPAEGAAPARRLNPFVFLPAALCDMCGTSIMYIGLNLTVASSFQMLRGAVIIFTALLSVAFLGRVIKRHMWVGMFVILIGLLLVGLSDIVIPDKDQDPAKTNTNGVIAGDLLIIMAQIIVAVQMVYEERFVMRYNVHPLVAVGLEGMWGALCLGILLVPFYYLKVGNFSNTAGHRLENVPDAIEQMKNNKIIILAIVGNIVSIAFFNFAGISVTKEMSATTRMVLDSVRTIVIWVFSIAVQWQHFKWLQVPGFLFLVVGMALYNDLIIMPLYRQWKEGRQMVEPGDRPANNRDEERERLLGNTSQVN